MTTDSPKEVSLLLSAWSDGDQAALDKLVPLVYEELHRLAHRYISRERPGNALQTTALAHEAYLRLVDVKGVSWQNRAHFFAVAAQMMRRILVDLARVQTKSQVRRWGTASLTGWSFGGLAGTQARTCSHWMRRCRDWRHSIRGRARWWSCGTLAD